MLGYWVRNYGLICILSIRILGDDWGIPSSVTEGQNETTSTNLRGVRPTNSRLFSLSVQWQTSTTDRHSLDGPSCITIMVVRDPSPKGLKIFSKCPTRDLYDGPSCSRRSVLQNVMVVRDPIPKGLKIFSKCPTMDLYDGPSCSRRSILYTRHNYQRPLPMWSPVCWKFSLFMYMIFLILILPCHSLPL